VPRLTQLRVAVAVEQAVRIGDVFALLVEYYHAEGNMQQSYVLIEKMQERKIIINPYLDTELVRVGNCIRSMHSSTDVLDSPVSLTV
jgi:intraflagellar transport protein 140